MKYILKWGFNVKVSVKLHLYEYFKKKYLKCGLKKRIMLNVSYICVFKWREGNRQIIVLQYCFFKGNNSVCVNNHYLTLYLYAHGISPIPHLPQYFNMNSLKFYSSKKQTIFLNPVFQWLYGGEHITPFKLSQSSWSSATAHDFKLPLLYQVL